MVKLLHCLILVLPFAPHAAHGSTTVRRFLTGTATNRGDPGATARKDRVAAHRELGSEIEHGAVEHGAAEIEVEEAEIDLESPSVDPENRGVPGATAQEDRVEEHRGSGSESDLEAAAIEVEKAEIELGEEEMELAAAEIELGVAGSKRIVRAGEMGIFGGEESQVVEAATACAQEAEPKLAHEETDRPQEYVPWEATVGVAAIGTSEVKERPVVGGTPAVDKVKASEAAAQRTDPAEEKAASEAAGPSTSRRPHGVVHRHVPSGCCWDDPGSFSQS
ncbi:hypothetical protein DFJ74DRAFT_641220 [Hyaloraphidium curvatum]|nr:hypothetical protein DFJ74DRAFT_641220 [Hyaloraphidium curvatum]